MLEYWSCFNFFHTSEDFLPGLLKYKRSFCPHDREFFFFIFLFFIISFLENHNRDSCWVVSSSLWGIWLGMFLVFLGNFSRISYKRRKLNKNKLNSGTYLDSNNYHTLIIYLRYIYYHMNWNCVLKHDFTILTKCHVNKFL